MIYNALYIMQKKLQQLKEVVFKSVKQVLGIKNNIMLLATNISPFQAAKKIVESIKDTTITH